MAERRPRQVIEKSRKLKTVNNRTVGDSVVVFGGNKLYKVTIRQIGIVGFYVNGLATCFYWHEVGRLWRDYVPETDSNLAPVVKKW
jgi:hypothetical protein